MNKKTSNTLLVPIVITGITVGFLVSAYKFVFKKSDSEKQLQMEEPKEDEIYNEELDTE